MTSTRARINNACITLHLKQAFMCNLEKILFTLHIHLHILKHVLSLFPNNLLTYTV